MSCSSPRAEARWPAVPRSAVGPQLASLQTNQGVVASALGGGVVVPAKISLPILY
jgi:hypothetical protein